MGTQRPIPSPQELGLPEKYQTWRPDQEEAIRVIITQVTRGRVLAAPTGFGKQVVCLAAAIILWTWYKIATCIVTESRGLQDQYMEDGEGVGLVDLRGRANYKCEMREDYTCEDGYASQCPYKGTAGCPSSAKEIAAACSPYVVTNYDKWTASKKYGTGMSHFQAVIFDEGHQTHNALAKAMQVKLNFKEIEKTLQVDFPADHQTDDLSVWKQWAMDTRAVAQTEMQVAYSRLQDPSPKASWVKHYNHMKNLVRRLGILATARAQDWVVEGFEDNFQFDPIRPAKYAEAALLLRVPNVIVVSATVRPKSMYMIGMGSKTFTFTEFGSSFDPRDCPIYYVPTMRVDVKATDLSMLWVRHDQIAAQRQDRKGIVHTISYTRQGEIQARSRFAHNMLINSKGEPPTRMIKEFRESGPGTELVTPSVGTGYDFPGKDCEWQMILKVPFAPPSKIMKAREADDPQYRYYIAMQSLVQMFGRAARFRGDKCENFICDDHMKYFMPKYGHLAPRWFHGFYQPVDILPQPPKRMP